MEIVAAKRGLRKVVEAMQKAKKLATVADVLVRMRELLRRGWTQGHFATSAGGRDVDALSVSAARFCLNGAWNRATHDLTASLKVAGTVQSLVWGCVPNFQRPTTFNDAKGRKKSEVIAVVSCAIEKARAQEAT